MQGEAWRALQQAGWLEQGAELRSGSRRQSPAIDSRKEITSRQRQECKTLPDPKALPLKGWLVWQLVAPAFPEAGGRELVAFGPQG